MLEVGFTQSWPDLVRIAIRWPEKTAEVRLVLIAKLTEKPTYLNPNNQLVNVTGKPSAQEPLPDTLAIHVVIYIFFSLMKLYLYF